jgi:hypothetical protein
MTTLSSTPDHFTVPAEAIAAPTRPPMSACDDEDGIPKYQVTRFHTIAPTSAASTTTSPPSPTGWSMMPLPTVVATEVPRNPPTTFITAAISSAARGVSARVDTEVAIAFAASWKPLV